MSLKITKLSVASMVVSLVGLVFLIVVMNDASLAALAAIVFGASLVIIALIHVLVEIRQRRGGNADRSSDQ